VEGEGRVGEECVSGWEEDREEGEHLIADVRSRTRKFSNREGGEGKPKGGNVYRNGKVERGRD